MARIIKITALFFLVLFFNRLFAQYELVFKTPFPQQYHVVDSIVDELIQKDSASAAVIIQQLDKAARQSNNELNLLNFRRSILQYRYINNHDTHDTTILNGLVRDAKNLLQEVDEDKYPEIAAMINVTIGNTGYYKTHRYNLAFEHYIKAYNLFKNIPTEKFPDKQYAQYAIALAYYQFNDYKNALILGREIESLFPEKNYVSIFTVDMIGMCYLKTEQYDSAIAQFEWILDNVNYTWRQLAWTGIVSGNIGNVYFLKGQYDIALPYLERAVNLTLDENIPDNTADFASYLSAIYLSQKNVALAKKNLEIAQEAAHRANTASNYYNVYKALADFYKQTGDSAQALVYLDSSIIFKDSLAKINNVNLQYQGEMAVEAERKKQQEKLFEEQTKKQVLTRNGLIIGGILVMIIIVLYFNRGRLKNKQGNNNQSLRNNY